MQRALLYVNPSILPGPFLKEKLELLGVTHVIGDAVVAVAEGDESCRRAVEAAADLVRQTDRENFRFVGPRLHLRVGVSAGRSEDGPPLGGRTFNRARDLAQKAATGEILVDQLVRRATGLPDYQFESTTAPEAAYKFGAQRLMNHADTDVWSEQGLVALYADRDSLRRDFHPARLLSLAVPGSTFLVAGRTLASWTRLKAELLHVSVEQGTKINVLLSSPTSSSVLPPDEQEDVRRDSERTRPAFQDLVLAKGIDVRETDQAIIDGCTILTIQLPGETDPSRQTLLVLQDINAAPRGEKPTLVFVCSKGDIQCPCMTHGLYRRTHYRFEQGTSLPADAASLTDSFVRHGEGTDARNNRPSAYMGRIDQYVQAAHDLERGIAVAVPPPFSVQFQVSGVCSTHCVMCDHHRQNKLGLKSDVWETIFQDVSAFGVTACTFSGGEPLMRPDIVRLLTSAAHDAKLKIGMLTNGTIAADDPEKRTAALEAVARYVSWVAISVDGVPDDDQRIRLPRMDEKVRIDRLKEFCNFFRNRFGGTKYEQFLSATVTLQKGNVSTHLRKLCGFIRDELGVPQINFKLATGAHGSLSRRPNYLLDEKDLQSLKRFLWESSLPDEKGNNLAYLRRCFAQGIFDTESAADGAPLRAYYSRHSTHCFAPYVSAVIDLDGEVYPCCHLYRDNHGDDAMSLGFRVKHALGNVTATSFGDIWNGEKYRKKRLALANINPDSTDYKPCGECTRYCQHNIAITQVYRQHIASPPSSIGSRATTAPVWI